MQALGVNIGQNLPNNFEDPDFVAKGYKHLVEAVESRNARLPVWGWKFPNAANYLDQILTKLRNPRFIIVYRDMVATSAAQMRWHNRSFAHAISEVALQQLRNTSFSERHDYPTMMVSYEKAIVHPERFISDLSGFLGMPEPDNKQELVRFMEPESYKSLLTSNGSDEADKTG